jgi:glutamate 5-kinase
VDGIYDRPPEQPGAQLLARLEVEPAPPGGSRRASGSGRPSSSGGGGGRLSGSGGGGGGPGWRAYDAEGAEVEGLETTSAEHDTTGGVATKIQEAAAVARLGAQVRIARAGSMAAAAACSPADLPPGWVGTAVRCEAGGSGGQFRRGGVAFLI